MSRIFKKSTDTTGRARTEWDLSLLYEDELDPRIELDVVSAEKAATAFEKKYKAHVGLLTPPVLARALTDYERLMADARGDRPIMYFAYRKELNARDALAEKRINQLSDRLTKAGNKVLFFELRIGGIVKSKRAKLLTEPALKKYRYYLENVFDASDHMLTEAEEKIMSLKSQTASELWIAGTEKIMNKRTVRFKGADLPLQEAISKVARLPKVDRHALWALITRECKNLSEVAENELNAVVLNKKINDELRGYPRAYSATIRGYENTEASIEALVEAVSGEGFKISADFYKLKSKIVGDSYMTYVDRMAQVGTEKTIGFKESVDILREVFYGLKQEYGEILDRMLERGQIDVFPKAGKTGGAFCSSGINQPTFVLLNHVNDLRSLTTFAHEMGHAIHSERSKAQSPLYQGYSTATAETASTLFENLTFKALFKTLSPSEQVTALHNKLDDDMAGVMRQIAFFNFERELHETIRREGGMTKEEMARMLARHLKAQLGRAIGVTEEDGYSFVYVSHFRRFFYVYTYAYGNLISNVLAEKWQNDSSYIEQIDRFLCAGGSRSPEQIFRDAGIDTSDPLFFKKGLEGVKKDVDALRTLSKKHA